MLAWRRAEGESSGWASTWDGYEDDLGGGGGRGTALSVAVPLCGGREEGAAWPPPWAEVGPPWQHVV